jgi:hypothetical protein
VALPQVEAVSGVALAGLDHRAFARSGDVVEQLLDLAVARNLLEQRREIAESRRKALATEIGNAVGGHVNAAIRAIAQAMR